MNNFFRIYIQIIFLMSYISINSYLLQFIFQEKM